MTSYRNVGILGWDRSSGFKEHKMAITDAKIFGTRQIRNAKMLFVMTISIHVPFSGLFKLGRVISETSWCIALRFTKSTNTSVGFETH